MKSNKHFHILLVLIFLFQTLVPPMLMAQSLPGVREKSAPSSLDGLFDETVSAQERQLLSEFIQYVTDSRAPREGLRKATEDLYKILEKDTFWFSIDIKDPEIADLLAEANSGRRYLSEKTAPVELELHARQRRLEKRLMADHEKITATGLVPDGFMERARNLASLYTSQDGLWDMKSALLYKIGALSDNVINNYLTDHPEIYSTIKARIDRSNTEMNDMADLAVYHNRQLLALKARYQKARSAYNGALAAELSQDRGETRDLIDVIREQSRFLNDQKDTNARHHAELLGQITRALEYRTKLIDQTLGQLGTTDAVPNPFYVAPGLGASDQSRSLAETYRRIARDFIAQTHLKAQILPDIKASLETTTRYLGQEHVFFKTLVNEAGSIPRDKKRDITEQSTQIVTAFMKHLTSLTGDIDRIMTLADGLDFDNPDWIIGNRADSAKAFRLNREIEKFMSSAENLDAASLKVDIRLYALLSGMDFDQAGRLKSYQVLEKTSLVRSKAVNDLAQELAAMQKLFDDDAALAKNLKNLGREIVARGRSFYKSKTSAMAKALEQNPGAAGQPYFEFLTGAAEQLKTRLMVAERMTSLAKEINIAPAGPPSCPDCPNPAMVWPELAELGTAYTDSLQQFDNLADIEFFFTPDKIKGSDTLSDARLLFDLSARLGNEPFLHLNPDSIDVVFTAGSRMVVVKGIGNPRGINLAASALGSDYLTQPPYIGGFGNWLSSKASSFNRNWIQPIGQKIKNTASTVVSTAVEVGGKIATKTGQIARATYNGAKNLVDKAGAYACSFIPEGAQVWAINTIENTFYDNGSFSLWKAGLFGLGAAGCVVTGGWACAAFALGGYISGLQGYVNTEKDYGHISKEEADSRNFRLDILGIIGGGLANIGGSLDKFAQMGKLQKILTFMGLNPDDLGDFSKWKNALDDLSKIKLPTGWMDDLGKLGPLLLDKIGSIKVMVDGLSVGGNFSGWKDKFKQWHDMLPEDVQKVVDSGLSIAEILANPGLVGQELANDLIEMLGNGDGTGDPLPGGVSATGTDGTAGTGTGTAAGSDTDGTDVTGTGTGAGTGTDGTDVTGTGTGAGSGTDGTDVTGTGTSAGSGTDGTDVTGTGTAAGSGTDGTDVTGTGTAAGSDADSTDVTGTGTATGSGTDGTDVTGTGTATGSGTDGTGTDGVNVTITETDSGVILGTDTPTGQGNNQPGVSLGPDTQPGNGTKTDQPSETPDHSHTYKGDNPYRQDNPYKMDNPWQ